MTTASTIGSLALTAALFILSSCGHIVSGEGCDLGANDITQAICDSAAAAVKCEDHVLVQKDIVLCSTPTVVMGKANCCQYTACEAQPTFPAPHPATCN